MTTQKPSEAPDFSLQWQSDSGRAGEDIYCARPVEAHKGMSFLNVIGMLYAPNTHVVVSDLNWAEPTALEFTPNRLGFSALVSMSSALIEYGYGGDNAKSAQLGRVLLMLPGKMVRSHQASGTVRTVTCSFEPAYAESILGPLADLSEPQISSALDVRSSLISAILLRLMHEALYPGPLQETVVESFGHALLVECAHWLSVEASVPASNAKLTARHLATIEEHLADAATLPNVAQLAAACGFSERYFAKLFREQMKCSIGQYIKSAQITKAKTYLLETDFPLKEIAYRLGYSTPANFSSAFRAATGSSPGKFRKAK